MAWWLQAEHYSTDNCLSIIGTENCLFKIVMATLMLLPTMFLFTYVYRYKTDLTRVYFSLQIYPCTLTDVSEDN